MAYVYGYHAQGEFEGHYGQYGLPRGGMGAISQALANGLQDHGGKIRTSARVKRVIVKNGSARGVELDNGEVVHAPLVVSNADPVKSLVGLLDEGALPALARDHAQQIDTRGSMARIHLLVDALPDYVGFEPGILGPQHKGLVIMGASPAMYEKAADAQEKGELPDDFVIEALIPSVTDPNLAPAGQHTLSLGVQQLPLELAQGNWHSRKEEWADKVMKVYFRYAPNIRDHILGRHVITPLDLQETYNITGGNIFHASMIGVENNFDRRPIPEAGDYRTPISGYYLCGSGSHPGGGVSGAPGHNAAHRIFADRAGRSDRRVTREDAALQNSTLTNFMMKLPFGQQISYRVARNPAFRKVTRMLNRTARSQD